MKKKISNFHKRYPYVDSFINLTIGAFIGGFVSDLIVKISESQKLLSQPSFWGVIISLLMAWLYFKYFSIYSIAAKKENIAKIEEALTDKAVEIIKQTDAKDYSQFNYISKEMTQFMDRIS